MITLASVICSVVAVCANPAPNVESINFDSTHQRVTASIDGVIYDSGLYGCHFSVDAQYEVLCQLIGPTTVTIDAQMKHWTTRFGGHPVIVQHYQLLGGTISGNLPGKACDPLCPTTSPALFIP